MKTKVINAKCPYCKREFTTGISGGRWEQILWGQYSSDETTHTCPKCNKQSIVSLTETFRYSARKMKGEQK